MARFRHRESGANVSATRLSSPKQIEAKGKGWITAGVGNWDVVNVDVPGSKHEVLEDHEFREAYEPTDADAEKALDAPSPADLIQTAKHEAPAPPDHTAAQALPQGKTAADFAAERRGIQEQAIAEEQAKGEDPITGEPIDPTERDTTEIEQPEIDLTGGDAGEDDGSDEGAGEEDLSLPDPAASEPPASDTDPVAGAAADEKPKSKRKSGKKSGKKKK